MNLISSGGSSANVSQANPASHFGGVPSRAATARNLRDRVMQTFNLTSECATKSDSSKKKSVGRFYSY